LRDRFISQAVFTHQQDLEIGRAVTHHGRDQIDHKSQAGHCSQEGPARVVEPVLPVSPGLAQNKLLPRLALPGHRRRLGIQDRIGRIDPGQAVFRWLVCRVAIAPDQNLVALFDLLFFCFRSKIEQCQCFLSCDRGSSLFRVHLRSRLSVLWLHLMLT